MPSVFDLMPASLWPVQPFMPPSDPLQPPVWPSSSAAGWTMPPAALPPGWPPATADADTSVSAWDRAMRQALAANGSAAGPTEAASAWSDQMLADAKRAHDLVTWAFGPLSAARAAPTSTAMALGAPQYLGGAPSNVVAASADAAPPAIRSPEANNANAPMQAPAGADEQPDLGAVYGNRNIAGQGERARAVAAMRSPSGAGVRARTMDIPGSDSSQSQVGPAMPTVGHAFLPPPLPLNIGFRPNRAQSPWSAFDDQTDRLTKAWKILGIMGGWEPVPDPASVTVSSSPYGVVAKKPLPPEFELPPPPPSAWQLPEPDWSWGSPAANELAKRELAAGIPLDKIFIPPHAPDRERRDLARLSDFFLHGSGNFVSGDPVTGRDVGNLGLSVFRTLALGLLGPEGAGVRATAETLEAPEAVGAAQAAHAASARTTGPFVGKLNAPLGPRAFPVEVPPARPAVPVQPASPIEPGGADIVGLPNVDPAVVPIVPHFSDPILVRELQAFRARHNLPENLHTVGFAETDVPGLENRIYPGASRAVRKVTGLPAPEPGPRPVEAPFKNPRFVDHAEEEAINRFVRDVRELGLQPEDLKGHELRIHLSRPPCEHCRSGLDSDAPSGVLKQLSELYPELTIHVSAEPDTLRKGSIYAIIRGGKYVMRRDQ
ncbi:MAG TPA: hypothetical protein VGG01_24750 [Xanthobacteraceae bacterium]|jgi:hypothetical protein